MQGRISLPLLVLVAAAACQASSALPLAALEGARASILLLEDLRVPAEDAARHFVLAQAQEGAPRVPPFVGVSGSTRLSLLEYRRGLDALGVAPGELEIASVGQARRALPRADARWVGVSPDPPTAVEQLPEALLALQIRNAARCPALRAHEVVLAGSHGHVLEMVPFGSGAVLVMTEFFEPPVEGRAFIVSEGGSEPVAALTATGANSLAKGPGESAWIGTEGGQVFRWGRQAAGETHGVLERRAFPHPPGLRAPVTQLDGGDDGGASELYAVSAAGVVARFGPEPELIDQVALVRHVDPRGVYRVGPGHAFAVFWTKVFEYRRGQPPSEIPLGDGLRVFQKLSSVPELGLLLMSDVEGSATVFAERDGRWSALPLEGELPNMLLSNGPEIAAPFAGGLLMAADHGLALHLRAYQRDADDVPNPPSYGLCSITVLETGNLYSAVALDERRAVVAGRQPDVERPETPVSVFFLTAD